MKDMGDLVEKIKLEPKPRLPKVEIPYMGKLTTFEILGFLKYMEEPVTPYILGKKLGTGDELTFGQTIQFINLYSSKVWNKKTMLEPYPVTMKIAQDYPNIYDERKETLMLTNTYATRENGKFRIGMKPLVMGMTKIDDDVGDNKAIMFYDGEAEVEDIEGKVSFLDENLWPAFKGTKVKRPTFSFKNKYAKTSPVCVFLRDEKVQVHTEWLADTGGGGVQLPIVRKIE
jgi:hypothetical protein